MAAGSVTTGRVIGRLLGHARTVLVRSFLHSFDVGVVTQRLSEVVAWKVRDPHMSSAEQAQMWRVVTHAAGGAD